MVALDGMGGSDRIDHETGVAVLASLDSEAVDAVPEIQTTFQELNHEILARCGKVVS